MIVWPRRRAGERAGPHYLRFSLVVAATIALHPITASAQGSPYVPLDDPAYRYVDALLARGGLGALSALERPYPADALARAAARDTISLGPIGRHWARALAARARSYGADQSADSRPTGERVSSIQASLAADVELGASTSARGEMTVADDDAAFRPALSAHGSLAFKPFVAAVRYRADAALADAPDYMGNTSGWLPGRVEEAYVGARWPIAELVVGRAVRDWGPPTAGGLQIGTAPYSYDHLYGRLGADRLRIQTMLARLDDGPGLYVPRVRRYLVMHRLAGRWRELEWAGTESYVYSGEGRRLSLALSNPFFPALATHYMNDETGNVSAAVDLLWRSPVGLLAVQAMVDDYQFERGNPGDDEPPSYGLTVLADGLPLAGEHRGFASYTRVANLTYRTVDPGDNYDFRQVGLGRAFSDYDELRAGVELALLSALPVRAYAAYRRQGSGDYRLPFPPMEDYATTPAFLSRPVTRVTRVAISGGGTPRPGWGVEGDIGYNRVRGGAVLQAPGGRTTSINGGVAGSVRFRWTPAWLRRPTR